MSCLVTETLRGLAGHNVYLTLLYDNGYLCLEKKIYIVELIALIVTYYNTRDISLQLVSLSYTYKCDTHHSHVAMMQKSFDRIVETINNYA